MTVVALATLLIAAGLGLSSRSSATERAAAAPAANAEADAGEAAAPPPAIASFFESHCLDCHDADTHKGGLDLTALSLDPADPQSLRKWTAVHDRVTAGDMPPAKRPRPAAKEQSAMLASLSTRLAATDLARQNAVGRVPLRRLNRVEYEYTLRDLLALPELEVKEMLPPDSSDAGFDNVATAQDVSYVQMARYLEAAEKSLEEALCLSPEPPAVAKQIPFQNVGRFRGKLQADRGETRHVDEWLIFLRQPNSAQAPWRFGVKAPVTDGTYTIRVRCRGVVYDHGKLLPQDQHHVASIYTREKRLLGTFDIPAEAGIVEFKAWLHTGDELEFFCATLDDRTSPGAGDVRPYKGPGIAVEYVEVEGPAERDWPRESHRRLFGDLPVVEWTPESGLAVPGTVVRPESRDPKRPNKRGGGEPKRPKGGWWMVQSKDPAADADRLLREFMARAYRRPVEEAEVQRCLAFAMEAIQDKRCFQDAMLVAYKVALCSPDFLFLQETPGTLDAWALASRLSYFLWRSTPDATLLKLAASGELSRPEILDQQVTRMLADPKSSRFVSDFTGQWLSLREIQATVADKQLYPEYFCDNHAVESMVAESEAFFRAMLDRDLPAKTVVASDFLTINQRLAEIYDIKGVVGSGIRTVPLPKESPRGGFLTQAAVLKVTANGLTTSPVIRGTWIMDRLLGDPAPPPPPDVGSIEPDTRGATTVREQLDLHRRNESCASCHVKIDPPGFALESFDVMGSFRTRYRSLEQGDPVTEKVRDRVPTYKLGPAVDCTGQTADGQAFKDIIEFRQLLLAKEEQIARNLARRLATFATGGAVSYADRARIEKILAETKANGHGLQSMVRAVVRSEMFRRK